MTYAIFSDRDVVDYFWLALRSFPMMVFRAVQQRESHHRYVVQDKQFFV